MRDIKALAAGTADNNHRCIRVSDRILKNVSALVLCNGRLRNGEIAALAADLTQTDRTDRTLCTEILVEFHKLLIDFKARMLEAVNQGNRIACITVTGAGAAIQRANARPAKQVELCTGAQRQCLVIILQQNDALGCNLVCNRTTGCHCFVRDLDILSKNTVHHRVFYAENNPVDGKRDSQQNCNRGLCTHQRALRLLKLSGCDHYDERRDQYNNNKDNSRATSNNAVLQILGRNCQGAAKHQIVQFFPYYCQCRNDNCSNQPRHKPLLIFHFFSPSKVNGYAVQCVFIAIQTSGNSFSHYP